MNHCMAALRRFAAKFKRHGGNGSIEGLSETRLLQLKAAEKKGYLTVYEVYDIYQRDADESGARRREAEAMAQMVESYNQLNQRLQELGTGKSGATLK